MESWELFFSIAGRICSSAFLRARRRRRRKKVRMRRLNARSSDNMAIPTLTPVVRAVGWGGGMGVGDCCWEGVLVRV